LVIAHRLATIQTADRILVLTDEGIVEEGSHTALLQKKGVYARLYESQFDHSKVVVT
jgi:ATP-binding cassette, subfamily B, bacterial